MTTTTTNPATPVNAVHALQVAAEIAGLDLFRGRSVSYSVGSQGVGICSYLADLASIAETLDFDDTTVVRTASRDPHRPHSEMVRGVFHDVPVRIHQQASR